MSSYLFLYVQPHANHRGTFTQWRRDPLLPTDPLLLDIEHTHTIYLDATTPPAAPTLSETTEYTHLNIYRFGTLTTIHSLQLKAHLHTLTIDASICSLHWATYTSITETNPPSQSAPVVVMVGMTIPIEDAPAREVLDSWYANEHIPALARVEGWMGSTRMKLVESYGGHERRGGSEDTSGTGLAPYLAVHEWDEPNGLGGEAWKAANCTPSTARIEALQVMPMQRSVWRSANLGIKTGN
ncbi:hypothetical protein BJX66DRAFT_331285 [Aspergillus keveii]|uniref:Uncharacterized protein n=1 Tax=Aspergillus keveii TaxID=714993 RepID=A0ABR4GPV3_9EURO